MTLPNFILIGPGRTGTSWVAKNLMLHPDIFIPRCKTTRFLTSNYSNGLDWYESHFKNRRESAVGESIGGPLGNAEAYERILRHMPGAKLIGTFRNPVDRAYSAMGRLRAFSKAGDVNATISFEDKLEMTPAIVDQGRYATHLQHLWSIFPQGNILILFHEQLKSNPRVYLRQIYEFLNVDPDFDSPLLYQKINATATVSAKSKVKKAAYRAFLRLNFFQIARLIDDSMQEKPEPLSAEARRRVVNRYYLEEISRLEQMLSVDLSSWRADF